MSDPNAEQSNHLNTITEQPSEQDKSPCASNVYYLAYKVGLLGGGLCGGVIGAVYKGMIIAIKLAMAGAYYHGEDLVQHTSNEIRAYEWLASVQGTIIPRVVAAEYGNSYVSCGGALLIMEKVGNASLGLADGCLYADEVPLSKDQTREIQHKALTALDVIHDLDVLHGDARPRNIRVSFDDDGMNMRWIDFGCSKECEDDIMKWRKRVNAMRYFAEVLQ